MSDTALGTATSPVNMEQDVKTVTVSNKPETNADFSSISAALASIREKKEKTRIVVDGGTYDEEALELEEGVQIVAAPGCTPSSENPVIVAARADHPVIFSDLNDAYLCNLKIDHRGPFGSMACVVVESGNLTIDSCVITGSVSVGVLVCGTGAPSLINCEILQCCGDGIKVADSATPTVEGCSIHDNDGFGIFCTGLSGGKYLKNEVFANSNAGVAARGSCVGVFEENKVYNGKQGGFWLEEEAKCQLIANDIYQNQKSGIQVGGHADPLVVRNIVRDGLKGGIVVHDHATGQFLNNEIMRNTMAGVGGTDFACPLFHSNIVKDGRGGGIVLHENCRGIFEKNQVIGNTHAGIGLKGNSNALFDGNYVSDGTGYGVWVQERAVSTLQNNVIERNMRAGVVVTDNANPTLAMNIIRDGKHAGLLIRHNATGRFRQNTLSHNAHGNVVLLEQAASELVANIISHGPLGGIIIRGTTTVTVRGNTICHNDGANIAVLDNSDPICDGNVLTNGAGRGLVIMDRAKGTYRFNMIRNSELAGVYVGRQSSPELIANCICDGKAAGILFEDEATGKFTHNIVCANQNEGVAVHGRARPTLECNVVLQGAHGGIWLDENAGGHFRGNVVEDSGTNQAYRCNTATAIEWRLAERNTNTAPAALAEVLAEWAEEKMRAPGGSKKVILVQNPDSSSIEGGVAMATQCSELMGLDPSRSCMLVARFLGDAGQFEDAEELIKLTKSFIDESGPIHLEPAMRGQQWGDMSLHCAELLNKWAAASPEYSTDLMVRAAEYAKEAAEVFASIQPQDLATIESFASALYWVVLNYATLCRLGGGEKWTASEASAIAAEALSVAHSMVTPCTPPHRIAELAFVDGVLCFCQAEALKAGHIVLPEGSPPVDEAVNELLATSLKDFEHAYGQWCEAYGEKHLQTVKAITMIGQLQSRINGKEAGIEWSRRELRIREELQGELHPRTQQARRNYTNMIDDKLRNRALDSTAISEAMKASQAAKGEDSTVVVAKFLTDAGEFENAEVMLRESQRKNSEMIEAQDLKMEVEETSTGGFSKNKTGEEYRRSGEVSLYCAELLNKWAAASPEYTKDIMIRAAEYAVDAVEVFQSLKEAEGENREKYEHMYGQSLYWLGLNLATLCRLGGCEKWTAQEAYEHANNALSECQKLRANAEDQLRAEVIFAQGVLSFCKAEAVQAGFLRSTKMEKEALIERKFLQALRLFQHANQLWTGVYGEKHLETVKAITMIGTLLHKLQGPQAGMEWYRKELKIREELQGEMHPRTQQARRIYTTVLDAKLQAERKDAEISGEKDISADVADPNEDKAMNDEDE